MSNIDRRAQATAYSQQVAEARRFFFAEPGVGRTSKVLGGGFERVRPDYVIDRVNLRFSAIEFVVKGRGTAHLGGRTFELIPGVVFIYDEGSPHRITTDPSRPLEKYFIDLRPGQGRTLFREAGLPTDQAWPLPEPGDFRRLLDELLHYGTSAVARRQAICDSLLRAVMFAAAPVLQPTSDTSQRALQTYQRCCRIIDAKALSIRSLAELASACEVDAAYLCRLFKRFDRQTPYARLTRRRMDLVAARLYSSEASVREIAEDFGQHDPFNFSRTFKSVFGLSPMKFRAAYARASSAAAGKSSAET